MRSGQKEPGRAIIVTGMSGSGKSSVLKCLEDLGYEAIDNLPLPMLGRLLHVGNSDEADRLADNVAIGIDTRTRGFSAERLLANLATLSARGDLAPSLLFVDCDDKTLRRRFSETRRRHPLAGDRPVTDGISHERELMAALRSRADQVIDTTALSAGDLRSLVEVRFALESGLNMALSVTSFAYRNGLPREADLVFDVRFLANPHYVDDLRDLTGLDAAVGEHIQKDPAYTPFFTALSAMIEQLLPHYRREGKSYLTIAVGCTGGRHRSVFVARKLAGRLEEKGEQVILRHRELSAVSTVDPGEGKTP